MKDKIPSAAIITIGTEILIGQITDTNSQFIAKKLFRSGFQTNKIVSISDRASDIKESITELKHVDLLVLTGGLGPTNDDITKNVLCELYECSLIESSEVLEDITTLVKRRNPDAEINERNRMQALVPEPGNYVRNKVGTAPGLIFDSCNDLPVLIALPGVPFEMQWLWENGVDQYLRSQFDVCPNEFDQFFVAGIPESELAVKLQSWENTLPKEWQLAYLPSPGIIKLRLSRPKDNTPMYWQRIEELRILLGNLLVGEGDLTLEALVAKELTERRLTISTAESCTGGKLAHLLTRVPGASSFFKGGMVAYANEVKTNFLNVELKLIEDFGAASQAVAEKMALETQTIFQTNIAIATTGIAGPTGGTPEKPVGTVWIAIAINGKVDSQKFVFTTLRDVNITRTCNTALALTLAKIKNLPTR